MLNLLAVHVAAPLLLGAASAPTPDIYVDTNAVSCATGTGSSADPVCSIGAAIGIAAPGDTIRIAPGTYVENIVIPVDLDFVGTGGDAVTIIDGSNAGSVVTIPAAVTVNIDGLTITNGRASRGGGLNISGDLVLSNSTVRGNRAENGAGIATDMVGGGANVSIFGSSIEDNYASEFGYNYFGETASGGGILLIGGTLALTNTTLHNNRAIAQSEYCSFPCFYNDRSFGGGISASSAELTITNSTISECKSDGWYGFGQGGGISAASSRVEITNSTISGNISRAGRSLSLSSLQPGSFFSHVTITGDRDAGALGPSSSGSLVVGGPLELRNTLIAGNSSFVSGRLLSLGHNLVDVGAVGVMDGVNGDQAGTIANPLTVPLGELLDNGGSTQTHALPLGSPAADAGDPLVFEPADQRGVARPIGARADIGAFESDGTALNLCFGIGTSETGCANCPCGNNAAPGTIGGCLNSAGRSARITATGDPSVSLPPMSTTDLRITMTGATSMAFSVMYSGDAVAPGGMANPCFGMQTGVQSLAFDGLRCAIVNTRRHGGRPTDANGDVGITNNEWGGNAGPPIGIGVQAGFVAGQTRYFQAEYREDALLSCMRGLNTSQAVEVTFTP